MTKQLTTFMSSYDYQCFLITPTILVPIHLDKWWYFHMDNFTNSIWANGFCGIKNNASMEMLWRMYHSDNPQLMNSYELL